VGAFHNSRADSSKKSAENPAPKRFVLNGLMDAAIRLAKSLGLPLTHRNLYVIEKAVEAESSFQKISTGAAVEIIRDGAMAEVVRGGELNYFFFEDCRWRYPKLTFKERDDLRMREKAMVGAHAPATPAPPDKCYKCADSGQVWNQGPGPRLIPCPHCLDGPPESPCRKCWGDLLDRSPKLWGETA
jgi:hypothetical protein